jgi:hypothetical protein
VTFRERGYLTLPGLIPSSLCAFLYDYATKSAAAGKLQPGDSQVPNSPHAYGDPFFDLLLERLLPRIEEASGARLFPTYSYFRVYVGGATLSRHTDRPSCEISVTANLGYDSEKIWPIFVESQGQVSAVPLAPGDALLYRGIELPHWREQFEGQRAVQAFLHYVDQNGPHQEWRYDKRPDLTRSPMATMFMSQMKGLGEAKN